MSKKPLVRYSGLVHMVDLLPTVLSIAGVEELTPVGLDGVNQWKAINTIKHLVAPRTGFVYNIDDRWCGKRKPLDLFSNQLRSWSAERAGKEAKVPGFIKGGQLQADLGTGWHDALESLSTEDQTLPTAALHRRRQCCTEVSGRQKRRGSTWTRIRWFNIWSL